MPSRFIPVLTKNGQWVDFAPLAMLGTMAFPRCERSIEHFRRTFGYDEETQPSVPSDIGNLIDLDVASRRRQGHVVGQVALRFIEMSVYFPEKLSFNKAVYLAVEAAKISTTDGKPFKPKSTTAIREAVQHYRSVAHLWAAQVAFPELYVQASSDLDLLSDFLQVVSVFEARLDKLNFWSGEQPWRVPLELSMGTAIRVPPLSDDVLHTLSMYHPELR